LQAPRVSSPPHPETRISLIALSGLLAACSGLPPGVLIPVDCGALAPASPGLVEGIEDGTLVLTDEHVVPGTAQVVFTINGADGLHWYAPPARSDTKITLRTALGEPEPFWSTWVKLDCTPEAALFVNFWREDRSALLEPGDFPIKAVSFDVPDREQSGDSETFYFDGVVTITAVGDGTMSGYLQGRGGGTLRSNFTAERLELDYSVEALAFRDLPI
jgi:hypothetical protein